MKPVSLRPWRNPAMNDAQGAGEALLRNPTTGIAGCSACAVSGHAAAPARSVMNSRRFMCPRKDDALYNPRNIAALDRVASKKMAHNRTPTLIRPNVRDGSTTDIPRWPRHARFAPDNGHPPNGLARLLSAIGGLCSFSRVSVYHNVGKRCLWRGCNRHRVIDVSQFGDAVPSFDLRFRCKRYGHLGADARPNWLTRAPPFLFGTTNSAHAPRWAPSQSSVAQ
jgi:hypothetical protein